MGKVMLEKVLKMLESTSDADAIMGLRSVRGLLKEEGVTLSQALAYAIDHKVDIISMHLPSDGSGLLRDDPVRPSGVAVSGMPQCFSPESGYIEIVPPDAAVGLAVALNGEAAHRAQLIADHLKDALVAAVINKSRFKLKLRDVEDRHGGIVETILEAQYDRSGMMPVQVWSSVRGEVAALATVLRKAIAATLPELLK